MENIFCPNYSIIISFNFKIVILKIFINTLKLTLRESVNVVFFFLSLGLLMTGDDNSQTFTKQIIWLSANKRGCMIILSLRKL